MSLGEDVKVKEETLALAQRLDEDNRSQVAHGTLAPVELTRAQASVASARQDLVNSRGYFAQQELILKTFLSRRGTADPSLRAARIEATTPIDIPGREPVRPAEDLVAEAFRKRPELGEARLQIENANVALRGTRNELLPELDVVATGQNAGLAGQTNTLANSSTLMLHPAPSAASEPIWSKSSPAATRVTASASSSSFLFATASRRRMWSATKSRSANSTSAASSWKIRSVWKWKRTWLPWRRRGRPWMRQSRRGNSRNNR